jgi:hypothetical protein
MSVTLEPVPGCVPPARGTGRVLVGPDERGEWWASWQGGFGEGAASTNECLTVACTTEEEAVQWALAQPAVEWMICRDEQTGVWEHLR